MGWDIKPFPGKRNELALMFYVFSLNTPAQEFAGLRPGRGKTYWRDLGNRHVAKQLFKAKILRRNLVTGCSFSPNIRPLESALFHFLENYSIEMTEILVNIINLSYK